MFAILWERVQAAFGAPRAGMGESEIIMKKGLLKYAFIIALSGTIAACFLGCATQKHDMGQTDTCCIYTDGLLDDLCAIEYLSERYDNAIIILQDPEGLADNQYASAAVTDLSSLLNVTSAWFTKVVAYSEFTDISEADLYLLAPLTEFAGMLEDDPSLKSKKALMMAGDSDGPDGAGEDWNAIMDVDAYRYVTENMTDMIQITRPECESEFEKNGYPFEAQFLDEYVTSMNLMYENVCCYDLQAVALVFK